MSLNVDPSINTTFPERRKKKQGKPKKANLGPGFTLSASLRRVMFLCGAGATSKNGGREQAENGDCSKTTRGGAFKEGGGAEGEGCEAAGRAPTPYLHRKAEGMPKKPHDTYTCVCSSTTSCYLLFPTID